MLLICLMWTWRGGLWLGVNDVSEQIPEQIRLIFISLFFISPVALDWSKCAIFWGVCRVSGRCLGGVWWVSCTLRIVSGAYRCQINCNKSCRDDQLSVIHFLPVAYFGLGCAAVWVEQKNYRHFKIKHISKNSTVFSINRPNATKKQLVEVWRSYLVL